MNTNTTTEFSTEAYLSADVKGKAALRSAIAAAITEAVMAGDMDAAQSLVATQQTFTTPKATAAAIDWTARVVDLHATLTEALRALESGSVIMPEGVEVPDLSEVDWSTGTWTEADVKKFCTVSGRKAGRGAVQSWIESVVDDQPAKISDLRKRWIPTADYPQSAPSAGAIGAAFDRAEAGEGDGVEVGYEVVMVDGKRGAVAN